MFLPKVVGFFKMNTAKEINLMRKMHGVPVWHRNYYERIIRNENEFASIRNYIRHNPLKWEHDEDNPANIPMNE
jgi:REP element-mobilizing transposase RayT